MIRVSSASARVNKSGEALQTQVSPDSWKVAENLSVSEHGHDAKDTSVIVEWFAMLIEWRLLLNA
jgi:hypothetical protein